MRYLDIEGIILPGWQPWRNYCPCGKPLPEGNSHKNRLCDECNAAGHYQP